ncbi:MAG: DMT family transporter [Deltaproteobacteria bacterium]|nr:DMT family transporter [Deltaproteobacteria bacterium]
MRRQKLRARAELFGSAVLFGLMAVFVRLSTLRGFSGGQVLFVRMAVGAGMVVALFRARPGTWRMGNRKLLFTRGLFGGLAALLYFVALALLPAGEATLINNTFPVFAVLISFFGLEERPTFHIAVALLVATAGMLLVVGDGSLPTRLGWGQVVALVSAAAGGAAVTSIRALRSTDNTFVIFFFFTLGGMVVSVPFLFGAWPAEGTAWLMALAVGVLSFGAQILMTHAYGPLTVAEAAVWQQLTPVMSFVWAMLLLGERLSGAGALGVLLGIGGVLYGTLLGHRTPAAEVAGEGAPPLRP